MAKGFKHGAGGGNPLNFKVVGNPKPENPKENTIWVNTDKEIPEWMFSADEPSGIRKAKKSTGSVITIDDASDNGLTALKLYGKTVQNGTPTPTAPVPLKSVGADGNVAVTVCGKNLLKNAATTQTKNGVTFTVNDDGTITVIGTATGNTVFIFNASCTLPAGKYVYSGCPTGGGGNTFILTSNLNRADTGNGIPINLTEETEIINSRIYILSGVVMNHVFRPMIRLASVTDGTYEPYKEQSLTAQTPNGLPGIPVSSGGNHIDENGQQWICDEIDFARGKYVQRIGFLDYRSAWSVTGIDANSVAYVKTMSLGFSHDQLNINGDVNYVQRANLKCTTHVFKETTDYRKLTHGQFRVSDIFYVKVDGMTSADDYKSWMEANDFKMTYFLPAPIETDLTAEEIAQYSALHTNYPNTTIYNDEGAGMEVGYDVHFKDGFVWFRSGKASSVEFNALKKNGIVVYPIAVKQCVNGALVNVTAETYLGGEWLSFDSIPQFTYTGDYEIVNDRDQPISTSQDNWKIRFLTSGTLTFTAINGAASGIDVFCVGGGGNGGNGGGGGGYTNTKKNIMVVEETAYEIVVGAGGGGESSAFELKAAGGGSCWGTNGAYGGNGGSGGGSYSGGAGGSDGGNGGQGYEDGVASGYKPGSGQRSNPGPNGETGTTREFGEDGATLYAGGGGANGSAASGGVGGAGGGGGSNGLPTPNSGGGGGGHAGGTPAAGIVIIRNARG